MYGTSIVRVILSRINHRSITYQYRHRPIQCSQKKNFCIIYQPTIYVQKRVSNSTSPTKSLLQCHPRTYVVSYSDSIVLCPSSSSDNLLLYRQRRVLLRILRISSFENPSISNRKSFVICICIDHHYIIRSQESISPYCHHTTYYRRQPCQSYHCRLVQYRLVCRQGCSVYPSILLDISHRKISLSIHLSFDPRVQLRKPRLPGWTGWTATVRRWLNPCTLEYRLELISFISIVITLKTSRMLNVIHAIGQSHLIL
jgi:hypothetical protein